MERALYSWTMTAELRRRQRASGFGELVWSPRWRNSTRFWPNDPTLVEQEDTHPWVANGRRQQICDQSTYIKTRCRGCSYQTGGMRLYLTERGQMYAIYIKILKERCPVCGGRLQGFYWRHEIDPWGRTTMGVLRTSGRVLRDHATSL